MLTIQTMLCFSAHCICWGMSLECGGQRFAVGCFFGPAVAAVTIRCE